MKKDFNEKEHMTCPECGFETLYVDTLNHKLSYLFKDGKVDPETTMWDIDSTPEERERKPFVMCNSLKCDWQHADYELGGVK